MKRIIDRKLELLQAGKLIYIGDLRLTFKHKKVNKRDRYTLAFCDNNGEWYMRFCSTSISDIEREVQEINYMATTGINPYTGKPLRR